MTDITYTLTPHQKARRNLVSERLGRPLSDAEARLVDAAGDVLRQHLHAFEGWAVLSAILASVKP